MEVELLKKLLHRAGLMLSRRSYSRGELARRLEKFADAGAIARVLDRLEELNLLNDQQYAYNFSSHRLKDDGWGPGKIRQVLQRRHVPPELVEDALARVLDEEGEEPVLGQYLAKRFRKRDAPRDRAGVARLISHLRRRGFSEGAIYAVLRRRLGSAVWQRFDTGE